MGGVYRIQTFLDFDIFLSNYNRANGLAVCACGNRLIERLMSPKSQVMFASAFS